MTATPKIVLIGSGPTALYTLARIIESGKAARITVFELGSRAGVGTPYDRRSNKPEMLANIASIELPPVTQTLLDWVRTAGRDNVAVAGIDPETVEDRTFLPRVVLGDYFEDQMKRLLSIGAAQGCAIAVFQRRSVVDIVAGLPGAYVTTRDQDGALHYDEFDYAVIATGHQRPRERQGERGALNAYSASTDLSRASRVGILGTSLSAIDVAIGHAVTFGTFRSTSHGLTFEPNDPTPRKIIMMSRSGLLPEADFYCPIPYEPLEIFTDEAVAKASDLDGLFALFCQQLRASDPAYARSIDLDRASADTFDQHYFAARKAVGALQWAEENMVEVEYNHAHQRTVPWRYAILRMHEAFGAAVEKLSAQDRQRFDRGIKKVFVDNYAAVPPLSIKRLLALRDCGVLDVVALSSDYTLEGEAGRWRITSPAGRLEVDTLIDAMGQQTLSHLELEFPTLRMQLHALSVDGTDGGDVTVDEAFRLAPAGAPLGRVYFAALPFLLKRKPFIQGLTASKEIGTIIADAIIADAHGGRGAGAASLHDMLAELENTSLIICATAGRAEPIVIPRRKVTSPQET